MSCEDDKQQDFCPVNEQNRWPISYGMVKNAMDIDDNLPTVKKAYV